MTSPSPFFLKHGSVSSLRFLRAWRPSTVLMALLAVFAVTRPVSAGIITVPNAPTGVNVSGVGNGSVSLTFVAPGYNGGDAIQYYEFSTDNGTTWAAGSPPSTSTSVTLTEQADHTALANGISYQIKVRAVNSIGAGAASSAAGV